MTSLPDPLIHPIVANALREDLGRGGDITAALLPASAPLRAAFRARRPGVAAGLSCARLAMRLTDPLIVFTPTAEDGAILEAGSVLATVDGPARSILTAERTALNFLTLLSGVATHTRRYVEAVAGTKARIAATRKTLPGLRALQKQAVTLGGGLPHRFGLDDAVLIKDNHVAAAGSIEAALAQAKAAAGHMRVVEVEVDSLAQLEAVLPFAPHAVLLDNFDLKELRAAVAMAQGRVILEASGGVRLETVRAIAETGVDIISVGALTHSAPALDIGLDAM